MAAILFVSALFADCDECYCQPFLPFYKASIGPEVYHIRRTRQGGGQSGDMIGLRASLERIGRYKWYVGVEGLYGQGTIRGHSTTGFRLKSKLTDCQIEGRLGYTFQAKKRFIPAITPYIGYGYSEERNNYKFPSPLLIRFNNYSPYFAWGFLSTVSLTPEFMVGLNLKARSLINSKCRVKNDPEYDNLSMLIRDKTQYRVELPLYYAFIRGCEIVELGLVPFYEARHYGGRQNYPFDFFDTRLRLYGVNFQFTYRF